MRLFDTCAHDPRNASSDLYFCPISTDERHRPAGRSGQCSDNCEQIDYVGSALPVCESSCPASDATATAAVTPPHHPVAILLAEMGGFLCSCFNHLKPAHSISALRHAENTGAGSPTVSNKATLMPTV